VLAAAFADYVWIRWALPSVDRSGLAELYRLEAGLAGAEIGGTWVAEDDGEVLAAAAWVPAEHPPPSPAIREALDRTVPAVLGDRREVLEAADAATRALWPEGPVWLLSAVGTLPAARGRGLAGALVAEGLRAVDAAGCAAVLETSSEANVRLYRRCGFEVHAEVDPPGGAPHVWVMVRPAAS
jgi:GNAT superfamily N-acetyltransferase